MCICAGKDSEFSADIGNANTLTLIYLSKAVSYTHLTLPTIA